MLLNYLDSSIGFVVVILMFSLLITVVVQMIGVLLQLRGKSLLQGVETLLHEIDPDLGAQAQDLAKKVLTHPAITENTKKLGIALRSQEVKLVLESLARENPEVAKALAERKAQLFAKIDDWYEPVMDRVSERFKMKTRWVSAVFAVLLAFGLQLDSIKLFQQISTNAELRGRLTAMSDSVLATSEKVLAAPAPATAEGLETLKSQAAEIRQEIAATELEIVPKPWRLSALESARGVLGLLLSAFLLGLGAPFWYGVLKNLVGLRHVADQKDEQREIAARAAR